MEEALPLALLIDEEEVAESSKIWAHEINLTRETKGEFHTMFVELRADRHHFYTYFRMSIESFDELLSLIQEDIVKEFTNFRRPIEPTEQL